MIVFFIKKLVDGLAFIIKHFLPTPKHRANIRQAHKIIKDLRQSINQCPRNQLMYKIRQVDPFVFEEILLTCLQERGFKIKRNRRYTGDGGIDGIFFTPAKEKFLIQAKRYADAINPLHVKHFVETVKRERATGGYFIHTGRTGLASKVNLMASSVEIISGNKLLNFLLGLPLHYQPVSQAKGQSV
jgi:restriction system protein